MAADADYLERIAQVMEGMAADLEKNKLPRILRGVITRAMIEGLLRTWYPRPGLHKAHVLDILKSCKYSKDKAVRSARRSIARLMASDTDECYLYLGSLRKIETMLVLVRATDAYADDLNRDRKMFLAGIKTEEHWKVARDTIMLYIKGPSAEQEKEKKLREMEYDLIGMRIPGFFPTPKKVAAQMVRLADIQPGMTVLEPSAGKGDIAEVIAEQHPEATLTVVERNYTLAKVLEAKGFNTRAEDFLDQTGFYDRIVMNPPFENGQDIEHVRYAYARLKPGGSVISIMCEGPFFRKDRKAAEFREWFKKIRGTSIPLEPGSFTGAAAFNQTGVSTRIVILSKNGRR